MKIFDYSSLKQVIVSGDIHGDFETLVHKLCVQYQCKDTLLVVAGDCGFGFHKEGFYDALFRKVERRLSSCNNYVVFVRGNHDDPSYFQKERVSHERWRCVPDYSVLKVCGHNILCIGGAISIDRAYRKIEDVRNIHSGLSSYWPDEAPVFLPGELCQLPVDMDIDCVLTHSCPSFCELQSKAGMMGWVEWDSRLLRDVAEERNTMDEIFHFLKEAGHSARKWFYGHFHRSWNGTVDGTDFSMLDIMEFKELR